MSVCACVCVLWVGVEVSMVFSSHVLSLYLFDPQMAQLEHRTSQLSHASSSSPQIGIVNLSARDDSHNLRRAEVLSKLDISSHSENKVDLLKSTYPSKEKKGSSGSHSGRLSLPNIMVNDDEYHNQLPDMATVVIPPPVLYLNRQSPVVDIEIESGGLQTPTDSRSFTVEEETFFAELMSNSSEIQGYSDTGDSGDPVNQSHGVSFKTDPSSSFSMSNGTTNQGECHDEDIDDNVTPRASPHTSPSSIRKQSVQKINTSPMSAQEDNTLPTPTASPYVNRPLSLSSRPSSVLGNDLSSALFDRFQYLSSELGVLPTFSNTASTVPKGKALVVRSHSFGGDRKKRAVHGHQESRSTETTPQSTPVLKRNGNSSNERVSYSHSGTISINQEDVEAVHSNLGNVELDLKAVQVDSPYEYDLSSNENQSSTILPPPVEFMDEDKQLTCDHPGVKQHETPSIGYELDSPKGSVNNLVNNHIDVVSSKEDQEQLPKDTVEESLTQAGGTVTVITPYQSNPEEMMSFDEVLASFDNYASTTGKTTKSSKHLVKLRSRSPEAKRRKEKKKKRSQTVAGIDADTMNQVKEELARRSQSKPSSPQQTSDSNVHQLAREYSRKVKDHQRSRIFKRFSTVVEEPSMPEISRTGRTEPHWLQQLKERKKTTNKLTEVTSGEAELCHPHLMTDDKATSLPASLTAKIIKDNSDLDDEQQRKGGFKGWVRSLVDKISTSGNVKDK